jgi:hypothetical protein
VNYDRLEVFVINETPESWLCCNHCGRAYQLKNCRTVGDMQLCAYPDCSGDTIGDARNWDRYAELRKDLPKVPELHVEYW